MGHLSQYFVDICAGKVLYFPDSLETHPMIEQRDQELEAPNKPEHRRVRIQDAAAMIDEAIATGKRYHAVLAENKVVVAEYELPSGYTVPGRSAMIDPTGFNLEEGLNRCRDKAIAHLQAYLAFHVEQQRYEEGGGA